MAQLWRNLRSCDGGAGGLGVIDSVRWHNGRAIGQTQGSTARIQPAVMRRNWLSARAVKWADSTAAGSRQNWPPSSSIGGTGMAELTVAWPEIIPMICIRP